MIMQRRKISNSKLNKVIYYNTSLSSLQSSYQNQDHESTIITLHVQNANLKEMLVCVLNLPDLFATCDGTASSFLEIKNPPRIPPPHQSFQYLEFSSWALYCFTLFFLDDLIYSHDFSNDFPSSISLQHPTGWRTASLRCPQNIPNPKNSKQNSSSTPNHFSPFNLNGCYFLSQLKIQVIQSPKLEN